MKVVKIEDFYKELKKYPVEWDYNIRKGKEIKTWQCIRAGTPLFFYVKVARAALSHSAAKLPLYHTSHNLSSEK